MNHWPRPTPLLLLLLLPLVSSCSRQAGPETSPEAEVVARIGSREIRVAEFRDGMARRSVGDDPAAKEALLEELLEFGALVEKARELGLDQDPGLRRAWENLLVARLRERQFEPLLTNAVPTAAQVQARYETNPPAYTEPAQRRGAILFFETPPQASPEQQSRLRQRLDEARAKALNLATNEPAARGFGALAVEYSEDQATRYRGGDIGWVQAGRGDARFDAAVLDTLFKLPAPGSLSEPVMTPRGCYLVKLLEVRPQRVKPLAEVRAAIEHALLIENRRRIETEWKQSVRAGRPVQRFPEVLARVTAPASNRAATSTAPPPVP
jgi:parvulin-like peptidyl-prolyl isomerase